MVIKMPDDLTNDDILDNLGIALQTNFSHTRWVPLRKLINAVVEAIKDKIREEDDADT